jgi:hypothetical protein
VYEDEEEERKRGRKKYMRQTDVITCQGSVAMKTS